jgi:hypothetical protein
MKSRHGAAKRAPEKKPGIFQLDDIPEVNANCYD